MHQGGVIAAKCEYIKKKYRWMVSRITIVHYFRSVIPARVTAFVV